MNFPNQNTPWMKVVVAYTIQSIVQSATFGQINHTKHFFAAKYHMGGIKQYIFMEQQQQTNPISSYYRNQESKLIFFCIYTK